MPRVLWGPALIILVSFVACDMPMEKQEFEAEKGHATGVYVLSDGMSFAVDSASQQLKFDLWPDSVDRSVVQWSLEPEEVASIDRRGGVTPKHAGPFRVQAQIERLDGTIKAHSRSFFVSPASTLLSGTQYDSGYAEGAPLLARFGAGATVAPLPDGTAYVVDWSNRAIRRVAADGATTLVAQGSAYSTTKDGWGTESKFDTCIGLTVGADGALYVVDSGNRRIRRIAPDGKVSTFAGSGAWSSLDGTGTAASFSSPKDLVASAAGDLFVLDGPTIRRVTPQGAVTLFAGSYFNNGTTDGTGSAASFFTPRALTIDPSGNLYVAESKTIRMVTPGGVVTTLAGKANTSGYGDGVGAAATFTDIYDLTYTSSGDLLVADGSTIRRVSTAGVVTTWASSLTISVRALVELANGDILAAHPYGISKVLAGGTSILVAGSASYNSTFADGVGTSAGFLGLSQMHLSPSGDLLVSDYHAIRRVTPAFDVKTVAGSASYGYVDGDGGNGFSINQWGWAVADALGNLYFTQRAAYSADATDPVVRKMTPAGVVSTIAGVAGSMGTTDGTGKDARFRHPQRLLLDAEGNLLVVDRGNKNIRKVTPEGVVTTVTQLPNYPHSTSSDFALDPQGAIIVVESGSLYRLESGGWVKLTLGSSGSASLGYGGSWSFVMDSLGQLWYFSAPSSPWSSPSSLSLARFGTHGGISPTTLSVNQACIDHTDTLWVVVRNSIQKIRLRRNP